MKTIITIVATVVLMSSGFAAAAVINSMSVIGKIEGLGAWPGTSIEKVYDKDTNTTCYVLESVTGTYAISCVQNNASVPNKVSGK